MQVAKAIEGKEYQADEFFKLKRPAKGALLRIRGPNKLVPDGMKNIVLSEFLDIRCTSPACSPYNSRRYTEYYIYGLDLSQNEDNQNLHEKGEAFEGKKQFCEEAEFYRLGRPHYRSPTTIAVIADNYFQYYRALVQTSLKASLTRQSD